MKPRLLDLFCCAGGAAKGYADAGFDVTGVDIRPQPRYPFRFVQGDALEYLAEHGHEYDAIHASPPCQAYTAMRPPGGRREHPDLLGPTRDALLSLGCPWVIENVVGSPVRSGVVLCGSMFGLGAWCDGEWRQLRRHRYFEASFFLLAPPCTHKGRSVGVYGDGGSTAGRRCGWTGTPEQKRAAMGIDWMNRYELSQAIPPAYTRWIGAHLMRALEVAA